MPDAPQLLTTHLLPPAERPPCPLSTREIEGDGPTVVLIHGLGRVAATWAEVVHQLNGQLRLLLPDNPGFGGSHHLPVPRTIEEHAQLHLETLEAINPPKPWHIAGLSLGGMIAPALAARLGDRCASLTCFSSSSRETGLWRLSPSCLLRMAARTLRYGFKDHRVNMPELVQRAVLESDPTLPTRIKQLQIKEGFSARNGKLQLDAAIRWRIKPSIPLLPKRRLVVVGENDRLVPPKNSIRLAKLLNAPIRIIPNTGHDLGLDAPGAVAHTLHSFCVRNQLPEFSTPAH